MRAFRRRTLWPALVAAFAVTSFAGSAQAAVGPPAPDAGIAKKGQEAAPALTGIEAEQLKSQQLLLPIANKLATQSRSVSSDIAGVSIDPERGTVHVYRKDPSIPLGIRMPAGVNIELHEAKFSRTEMNAAGKRLRADAKLLGEQKVSVAAVGPALDGSGLTVSVVAPEKGQVEQASELLKGRYGDVVGNVSAIDQQTFDKQLFFGGFRFNDFSPWYGGDRIRSNRRRLQHRLRGQPQQRSGDADRRALRRRGDHVLQRPAQQQHVQRDGQLRVQQRRHGRGRDRRHGRVAATSTSDRP